MSCSLDFDARRLQALQVAFLIGIYGHLPAGILAAANVAGLAEQPMQSQVLCMVGTVSCASL